MVVLAPMISSPIGSTADSSSSFSKLSNCQHLLRSSEQDPPPFVKKQTASLALKQRAAGLLLQVSQGHADCGLTQQQYFACPGDVLGFGHLYKNFQFTQR